MTHHGNAPALPAPERGPAGRVISLVGRERELERFTAALRNPGIDAFVITGAAGVGKTRLADECLTVAAAEGMPVARAVASQSAMGVPFGALAHLLTPPAAPASPLPDAVGLYSWARQALRCLAGDRPLVLFVDDMHLLDAVSLTLLAQFADAGDIFLIATLRHDEPLPDLVRRVWSGDRSMAVELTGLDRAQTEKLLLLTLGGPVAADTTAALWRAGRGNALFLRELVLGALEDGRLALHEGMWRLAGEPLLTSRLRELVTARIRTLEPRARAVLEHLALCQPVGASDLTRLASAEVLERLEHHGLIEVRADGRRRPVTLSHPLYARAIRDRLPRLTADRILRAAVDRVREAGARRSDDPLRLAIWQLDGAGGADPELLLRAARLSRAANDFPQAERLARAALAAAPEEHLAAPAATLLGDVLGHLGRIAEADEMFARSVTGSPATDMLRALNLAWGWIAPGPALALLDRVRTGGDERDAEELSAVRALVLAICLRPREAYELLASSPGWPRRPAGRIGVIARVSTFAMLGRTEEALAAADAIEQADDAGVGGLIHPVFLLYGRVLALHAAGRPAETIAAAEKGLDQAITDGVTASHAPFACMLGRGHLEAGRPRTALRWFRESAAVARAHAVSGQLRLAYAGQALAHAALGNAEESRRAVYDIGPRSERAERQDLISRAQAWSLAAGGHHRRAIDRLLAAARVAEDSGNLVMCAVLLHDVARLGAPDRVADRLGRLAAAGDSPMVTARMLYAAGVAHSDTTVLERACAAFESLGAMVYAAEAAAQAQQRRRDPRGRAALAARVTTLLRHCEGARTPPLLGVDSVIPLSRREREVCSLAAQGHSSREIAARLTLSVRTVDNYLQRAYVKLGVSGRAQLASALGSPDG